MAKSKPCPNCGALFPREWYTAAGGGYRCPHCKQVDMGLVAPRPEDDSPIVVRAYSGYSQAEAVRAFERDATAMAAAGYRVASQSWDSGRRGVGGVLLFGVLSPKTGTLTVTYERQSPVSPTATSLVDELAKLGVLREQGVLSGEEFEAAKRKLLDPGTPT